MSLLDVTATLTAGSGGAPLGVGRDLRTLDGAGPVQIEFYGNARVKFADRIPARAVVLGRTKLIESSGFLELYRLEADPLEETNVTESSADEVRKLSILLPPLSSAPGELPTDGAELLVEDVERLRALGYTE